MAARKEKHETRVDLLISSENLRSLSMPLINQQDEELINDFVYEIDFVKISSSQFLLLLDFDFLCKINGKVEKYLQLLQILKPIFATRASSQNGLRIFGPHCS